MQGGEFSKTALEYCKKEIILLLLYFSLGAHDTTCGTRVLTTCLGLAGPYSSVVRTSGLLSSNWVVHQLPVTFPFYLFSMQP